MKIILKILIIFFILLLIFFFWYLSFISNYSKKIYTKVDEIPTNYAALVFGAQIWGQEPSYMLYKRIEAADDLYKAGKIKKIIMSGDNRFENYNEPQVMIEAAKKLGIPEEDLSPDYAGRSTYESCFRAKYIFGQDKIVIVTQRFHLNRALYLCQSLGIDAIGFEADNQYGIDYRNLIREVLATVLAIYQINFEPRDVVGGEKIEI